MDNKPISPETELKKRIANIKAKLHSQNLLLEEAKAALDRAKQRITKTSKR